MPVDDDARTRDPFGLESLHHARVGDQLAVGPSIPALRHGARVSSRLNETAIADFLLFGLNRDPHTTTFKDIQAVPPGHRLVWEGGEPRVSRYWTLEHQPLRFRRPEEYVQRFREVLEQVVGESLPPAGDKDVAILLSGGLDSPSIAAAAVERLRRQGRASGLRAYTIAYDHLIPHEERRWASMVAEHLGIPIDIVAVDGYRLYERWDDPAMHTPEPIDNPLWALPVDMCRRIAANGHRVALSGEAGDATCAPAQFLPELLAAGHWVRLFSDAWRFWRTRGRRPALGLGTWWCRTFGRPSEPPPFPTWMNDSLVKRLGLRDRWREQWRPEDTAYEALASPEWPFCALTQHPSWTGVDLEFRYPFLDLRLVEFLLSVPAIPWADDKELLRVANEGRLPAAVLRRPKAPLTIDPVAALLERDGIPPVIDADGWLWEFVDRKRFEEMLASGNWERGDITPVLSLGRWLWHERAAGTLG